MTHYIVRIVSTSPRTHHIKGTIHGILMLGSPKIDKSCVFTGRCAVFKAHRCSLINVIVHVSGVVEGHLSCMRVVALFASCRSHSQHRNLLPFLSETTFDPLYFSYCLSLPSQQGLKGLGLAILGQWITILYVAVGLIALNCTSIIANMAHLCLANTDPSCSSFVLFGTD